MNIFPSIREVAQELTAHKRTLDRGQDVDVRLQVYEHGLWCVHTGDASYDQDHRGFWGASGLSRSSNCTDLACDLLDQCREHHACSQ